MKKLTSSKLLKHGLVALAAFGLLACDKTAPETKSDAPPAANPDAVEKPGSTTSELKAAEPTKEDIAKVASVYGFVARLPKDTDNFSALYRAHDLWTQVNNSKFTAALLDLPFLKADQGFQDFLTKWRTDESIQRAKGYAEALFGSEFIIAQPTEGVKKWKPWTDILSEMQSLRFQSMIEAAMAGKSPNDPTAMRETLMQNAGDLIPLAAKAEIPPMLFIMKTGPKKAEIEKEMNAMLEGVLQMLPPYIEKQSFKVSDQYDFQSLIVTASKAVPPGQQEELLQGMKNMIGNDAEAEKAMKLLMEKKLELAWGWVEDYLVLSLGSDHAHVKFVKDPSESVLAVSGVASRVVAYAGKKPLSFGYVKQSAFEALSEPFSTLEIFNELAADLENVFSPEALTAMRNDLKGMDARIADVFVAKYDTLVSVGWLENGLHSEMFGGVRMNGFQTTGPLGFGNLLSPATLMLINSRANSKESAKTTDLLQDAVAMIWGWYDKYGRTMIPEESRQTYAGVEAMALPMVKDFWSSSRLLGKALGDESAFVVDLAGSMKDMPMVPPQLTETGRVPRIAYVSELKDRAALSEAWKGYQSVIKRIVNFIPPQEGMPPLDEPQTRKEGDTDIYFLALPMTFGDLLPHVGASANRWILSTSPSLTKELASKAGAPVAGSALGARGQMSFTALWDFADHWLKLAGANIKDLASEKDALEFEEARPMIEAVLKLARCIEGADWQFTNEQGVSHQSTHLQFHDLK